MTNRVAALIVAPRLKADMLSILNSLRKAQRGDCLVLDHLSERFTGEHVRLDGREAELAIVTVRCYGEKEKRECPVDAAGLLVALGDTNAIAEAVQGMWAGGPAEKQRARRSLASSGQAKALAVLAGPLVLDEGVVPNRRGEDVFTTRRSVDATYVMLDILSTSGQFPPAVTSWARTCRRLGDQERRAVLRD